MPSRNIKQKLESIFRREGNVTPVHIGKYYSEWCRDYTPDVKFIETMPTLPYEDFDGYHPEREGPLGIELNIDDLDEDSWPYFIRPIDQKTVQALSTLEHYGKVPENLDELIRNSVWGNPHPKAPTYLRDYFLKLSKSKCGPDEAFRDDLCGFTDELTIRLEIDPKILAEMRDVYYDPEGSFINDEYLKTFFVTGGIPFKAIVDFELNPAYL